MVTYSNGVKLWNWDKAEAPDEANVAEAMKVFGYAVYDLQTVPPYFKRSRHSHDEAEIRGAVSIVIQEGKFRQVRKMTAAVGFPTLRLVRVRVGNITLMDLHPGGVREVAHFLTDLQ